MYLASTIATKNSSIIAIQCKCWSEAIGVSAIQEIYAGKDFYNAHKGVLITNSNFTKNAKILSSKWGIILIQMKLYSKDTSDLLSHYYTSNSEWGGFIYR